MTGYPSLARSAHARHRGVAALVVDMGESQKSGCKTGCITGAEF